MVAIDSYDIKSIDSITFSPKSKDILAEKTITRVSNGEEITLDFCSFISKNAVFDFSCDIDKPFDSIEIGTLGLSAGGHEFSSRIETRLVVNPSTLKLSVKDANGNLIEGGVFLME